jgi:hypothetical protein
MILSQETFRNKSGRKVRLTLVNGGIGLAGVPVYQVWIKTYDLHKDNRGYSVRLNFTNGDANTLSLNGAKKAFSHYLKIAKRNTDSYLERIGALV